MEENYSLPEDEVLVVIKTKSDNWKVYHLKL